MGIRQRRREVGVPLATPELAKAAREEEVLVCRCSGRMRSPYRCRCSLLGRKELASYPPLATTPQAARRRSLSRCRCRKLGGSLPALVKLYRPLWLLTRLPVLAEELRRGRLPAAPPLAA
ncbi:hypothetical protein Dimus_036388 [Dionaea muscipula]